MSRMEKAMTFPSSIQLCSMLFFCHPKCDRIFALYVPASDFIDLGATWYAHQRYVFRC